MPERGVAMINLAGPRIEAIREHRGWFIVLGIILIIIGLIAVVYDVTATVVSVLFVGWLLIVGGVVEVFHAFRTHGWGGIFLHLLAGLLAVIVGLVFVTHPLAGALTLTLVLGALFLVEGIFRLIGVLRLRFPGWGWAAAAAVITAILGLLLLDQWPVSALWFIGFAVGIDMIFRGWGWIMLAIAAQRIIPPPVPAQAT
jgi:uncharacterized membrane protein HdeD (DUF308 family)